MFRVLALCTVILAATATARADQRARTDEPASGSNRTADYRMDIAPIPGSSGAAGLRVTIHRPSDGRAVRDFEIVDEKPFHLFVVGRDLAFFRHLFPAVQPDGSLEVREPIPAGEYLIAAGFLPSGGTRQLLRRLVTIEGKPRPAAVSRAGAFDTVTNVKIQPLPFALNAGKQVKLQVMFSRTEDGRPLVNLEPYLGGGGYLLAVKNDLSEVVSARASTDGLPLSLLTFGMTFPTPGSYTVWVEFHRFDEILAARLGVTVR